MLSIFYISNIIMIFEIIYSIYYRGSKIWLQIVS